MSETRNLVILAGIFAIAFILGPVIERSNYNGLASGTKTKQNKPPEQQFVKPTTTPGTLFDEAGTGIGQIDLKTDSPFVISIHESCIKNRDYTDTYVDSWGTVTKSYDLKGWSFDKQLEYPAGTYEFYIDNLCPETHVVVTRT